MDNESLSVTPAQPSEEAIPAVPYAQAQDLDDEARLVLEQVEALLGFVPNAARTYMHRPDIAKVVHSLYFTIVLSPNSGLQTELKNKLGVICSSTNDCVYCTSHQCSLSQSIKADTIKLGLTDEQLLALIAGFDEGSNDVERVCFEFARVASRDPGQVSNELLERMKEHLSPAQIVELGGVVSMWKFFNTMHDSLHIPSEGSLAKYSGFIEAGRGQR